MADARRRHPQAPRVQLTEEEREARRAHHLFARNATEWLTITNYRSTQDCIDALRASGHVIWATDLSQAAVPLTVPDLAAAGAWPVLPHRLALVFGTEAVGVSAAFLRQADRRVYLPLRGFADSLNLSVATALVLFAVLQLEPRYVGDMPEPDRRALRAAWFPKLARQRLLTSAQKTRRKKLLARIADCRELERKQRRYEAQRDQQQQQQLPDEPHTGTATTPTAFPLTAEQATKLQKLPNFQRELEELERSAGFHDGADRAVADLIDHPPEPLTDLRRTDEHRVCFVGKNTKSFYREAWEGLAATTTKPQDVSQRNSSAVVFRQRARINDDTDQPESSESRT